MNVYTSHFAMPTHFTIRKYSYFHAIVKLFTFT